MRLSSVHSIHLEVYEMCARWISQTEHKDSRLPLFRGQWTKQKRETALRRVLIRKGETQ